MSDLPPGFELESEGVPPGFELEPNDVAEGIVKQATGLAAVPGPKVEPSYAQVVPRALEGFGRNTYGAGGAIVQAVGEIPTPVLSSEIQQGDVGGSGAFGDGSAPAQASAQGGGLMGAAGGASGGGGVPAPAYDTGERRPLAPGLAAAGRDVAVTQRQEVQKLREGIPEGISGKGVLFDVVTNAPQIAIPVAVGALNPAAGVAVGTALAGGTSFGNRYDELRNVRELPVGDAWQGAAVSAAAEVLTEKLALDAIIKTGKRAGLRDALKRVAVAAGAEGAQESLVQAIEEGYNVGVLGDETTLADALAKVGYAGLVGAIIGGGVKGIAEAAGAGRPAAPPPPPAGPAVPPSAPAPPAGPAPTAGPAVPPAGPTPAAVPPSQSATLPVASATDQGEPVPLDPTAGVDIENFGNEPLPADLVRQQFLEEQGYTENPDGSIATADGAVLSPSRAEAVRAFLAEADDAAATLEEQGAAVTPESVRAELKNRQRVRDLQTDRGNARTPEAQAVLDAQIAAASAPAGGAVSELQAVADQASARGDKQTAKAALDAIKRLQEPADGAVADRGSEGGSAVVERGLDAAAGAGSGIADTGGAETATAGTAPAGGTPVAVESGAVQPAAGVETAGPLTAKTSKPAKPSPRLKAFDGERLTDERVRNDLQGMADLAGWAVIGGELIRQEETGASAVRGRAEVVGRTVWTPNAPWFPDVQRSAPLTGNRDGKATKEAVRKALAGEPMSAAERRHVEAMLGELDAMDAEVAAQLERYGEEFDALMSASIATNDRIEDSVDNVVPAIDYALVHAATQIDEAAVERAAIQAEDDDAAFMAAIREIVNGKAGREGADRASGEVGQELQGSRSKEGRSEEGGAEEGQAPGLTLSVQTQPRVEAKAQPRPVDLFGAVPVAQQAIADRQREQDKSRNGTQDVSAGVDGGLFSDRQKQTDIADAPPASLGASDAELQQVADAFEAANSRFDYGATGSSASDAARELRKISTVAKQADDDVELGNDKFVPLAKAVEYAREAIAAGIRPVPFQIGTALDIAPFEWQRVLTAAQAPTTLTDQLAGMSDAELEALIDDVAHESGAAESEKPKAKRSAKTKPPKADAKPKLRKGRTTIEKAEKPADVKRTVGEISGSLGVNLSSAGQNALTGLTKLFGTSGKINSGLTFDEDTYRQAKPYFQALLRDFQAAGKDIRDLIRELLNMLGTGAKPYILRFAQDLRSGKIEADNEQADVRGKNQEEPDGVAPEADEGAEGSGDVRGERAGAGEDGPGAPAGADESGVSGARGRGSRKQRTGASQAGSGGRGGSRGKAGTGRAGEGVSSDPVTPAAPNIPALNFQITDDLRLGRGGEVEKFNDNIAAIEALQLIEAENRRATPDEQRLLARYVGWGGLASAFPDPISKEWKEKWKERGSRLADLLSKKEYSEARRSTRNAHYTSETVVSAMWRAARRLGFRGGLVLESSMGTGNFLGLKPSDLPAKFIGIEYDSLTARIASALYPQATVLHSGFQAVPLPDRTFALSIGNPPFGAESLRFQYRPEINGLSIHNQFFIGAVDAVRAGGLHVAVVSRFLMDAQDSKAREMLAERAELVAAIRLPDTAFKENARTEVVTDIIILQRRDAADQEAMRAAISASKQPTGKNSDLEGKRQQLASQVPDWVKTAEVDDPLGGEKMTVNRYFQKNPRNIIGVLERSGSMQHGADVTVRLDDPTTLQARLESIIDQLPSGISNVGQEVLDETEKRYTLLADALRIAVSGEEIGHVKLENNGTMSRVIEREGPDGSLLMSKQVLTPDSPFSDHLAQDENGNWYRNEVVVDDKGAPVKVADSEGRPTKRNLYARRVFEKEREVPMTLRLGKIGFAKLQGLAKLRDLLKKQLVLETEDAPAKEMEGNRKKLAAAYESFTAEHGPINRPNTLSLAMSMPDGGLVSALEVGYQPERSKIQAEKSGLPQQREEAKSAPILRERVVPKYEPPTSAGSAADALAIVLAERGGVDIERIAQLRGTSTEQAIEELQAGASPLAFLDPETQQWQTRDAYLSGQVRRKLEAAKAADLPLNVAALEAIQPAQWNVEDVTVKMGATWVPPETYAKFVDHLLGGRARVNFSAVTNSFTVDPGAVDDVKNADWSTDRATGSYIIGRILNSLPTVVYDTDRDGNQTLNQTETQLAQVKAREIVNAFDEWIFNDETRTKMLVELFNDKFNTRVSRQFDGSHLTLPGKVPDAIISMRRHQKNAIWRGISTRELLLDHVVGAGKTFTGIARVMERRRMGISRKPAIVVPNHLVEQWESDVYRLYPAAKVLAAGKKDFEAKNRRRLFGKIATGEWDVVIIPHSSFGFIGIAPETETRYLEAEMAQAQQAIEEAWQVARENGQDNGRSKPFGVKEAERLAEKIQGRLDRLREGVRDKLLTYEQLGIDDLTIDEAHEFKNLFYSSRLTGVRGMGNKTGSRKAADLYNKVRVTRDSGGAITFMTGTPVSNSAVELYTMMRYLAPESLEELGLTHFDAWRAQYVDASPAFEPTETGRLKQVTRMGRQWENMRSMMDLYYSFADAVSTEDIKAAFAEDNPGKEFPIPKVRDGNRRLIKFEPTAAQSTKLNEIIAGFDGLDSIKDPYERNAERLRLMDRARKVSLDVRAVDPTNPSKEEGGKLEVAANEVKRIYDANNERRGTQLIFLDRSVPKSKGDDAVLVKYDGLVARQEKALRDNDEAGLQAVNEELEKFDAREMEELRNAQSGGWNAYQQIKDNLIARGIPANEIRFIQEANTDEQKDALFDAVRGGRVRVLLGSTPRMGAGTNVQDRLVGLHHIDVTWKPSDIEQREGRIIRQGNLFATPEINGKPNLLFDPSFEVEIVAYATERTVDSKMWSLNATKLKTINGLRKYDGSFSMQIDDEESVSMAEMAALASGNPLLLERVQLESEINDLELQQRAHRRKVSAHSYALNDAREIIANHPDKIVQANANIAEAQKRLDELQASVAARSVEVEGKTYTKLIDAQKAVLDAITEQQAADEKAKYAVSVNGRRYTNKADIGEAVGEALGDASPFEMTIGGKVYAQRTTAARAVKEMITANLAGLSAGQPKTIDFGKVLGLDFVGDLEIAKNGKLSLDFALLDGKKTILSFPVTSRYSDKAAEDPLSVQALRAKVGEIISEYAKRASSSSADYYRMELERARSNLPALEAKDVGPFPKADALDQKIARLKDVVSLLSDTADTKGPKPSFNRGKTGGDVASAGTVAKVQSMVAIATAGWANKPQVVVVASMQDAKVPKIARDADAAQKAGGASGEPLGFIYRGIVYINAGAASSPMAVLRTLHHEALGHFGLRAVFGKQLVEELKKVALLRAADVKAKLLEYGMEDTADNRLRAAEEVLARMAETNPQLPLVQRVLAAIRSFLRPIFKVLGVTLELTDAEIIRDYLMPARDYVRRGSKAQPATGVPAFSRDADSAQMARRMARFVDEFLAKKVRDTDVMVLGPTPKALQAAGAPNLSLEIDGNVIRKALEGKHAAFGISADMLKGLPAQLEDPALIFRSATQQSALLVVTQMADRVGNPVAVAIHLSKRSGRLVVNRIESAHSRENAESRMVRDAESGLLAYYNDEALGQPTTVPLYLGKVVQAAQGLGKKLARRSDLVKAGPDDGTAFNRGPAAPATWQAPDPSRLDDFIHTIQDKNVDLKRIMQVMRSNGAKIADGQDAYVVEELNTSRKAVEIKDFLDGDVARLLKQMSVEGLSVEDVEEYLHARHAPEANARIAAINPNEPTMQDGGSGMLTQDALNYMNSLAPARRASLARVAQIVDDINADTRQLLVDSGLERPETIAEWESTYDHYVPLQREGFEDQASRGGGQGVSVRGSSAKSRLGSKRAVVDILANVVMQRERVITRAGNNRVGQALLGLAITQPNPDFWLPVNPDVKGSPARSRKLKRELVSMGLTPQDADGVAREPLQRYYNQATGLVETRVNPALRSRDNVIAVRVNGKDRFVFFKENDPRAMRMVAALKNLDARDMGRLMRALGSVTRYFAAINTQFNIIFGQVNFIRDVQSGLLNLGSTPIADKAGDIGKEARRLYVAAAKTAFRLDKLKGAELALWLRFRAAGGTTGFRDIFPTSTARTKAIKRELDPQWWASTQWGKVLTAGGALKMPEEQARQWVSHAFAWISSYNEALENVTRMAAFKVALDNGMTDQQAASLAKNLTANFNRRGAWSQQVGAYYAFFNAGVQGSARIAQALFKTEKGKTTLTKYGSRIIAGGIGLGVIQALALAGFDDDDPPQFVRERNLILPDLFFGTGAYVSIPMPLGWHVLPNFGRLATELMLRGGERPGDTFFDFMRIAVDAFNPLGSGSFAQVLSPTVADPIVALGSNTDWNGRPIARKDFNPLDPTPGFTRGKDSASVVGELIAQGLNTVSGGTDFTPGAVSPTPDQVDYLAGQIGGGVAREIIKAIDSTGTLLSGELPPSYRIPLAGRFVGTTKGEASVTGEFYRNLEKINIAENEAKGRAGRGEPIDGYLKKHPEALLKPLADKTKRELDKLKHERRERLAAGASMAQVRPITERMNELQKALNERVKAQKQ